MALSQFARFWRVLFVMPATKADKIRELSAMKSSPLRLLALPLLLSGLTLSACGGDGGSGGSSGGSGGTGGGAAPVFTSGAGVTVAENTTAAVYTATATDADGNSLTYGIVAGVDSARFTINATSGAVSFASAPNFEWPQDGGRDNIYDLTLSVSDGANTITKAITVSVTDKAGRVGTRRVGTGFSESLYLTGRGDGSGRVLVVQKGGLVRVLDPLTGIIETQPFMDLRSVVATDGERGLLGLALAPDFGTSGLVYAYLTVPGGEIQIRKFTATSAGVGTATGDVILTIPHPTNNNHNGGWIGFDANGLLVIGVGDGGGGGDPSGNAQNKNVLLGKILRIDPRTDSYPTDANRDYAIPASNPFAVSGGAPEIWHLGLRNPFRASFDKQTNDFYIGDVGQGAVEEIDLVRPSDPGLNFGWNILEGTQAYAGGVTTGLTGPVAQYFHGSGALQGSSLTGGYVYRGPVVAMRGHYLFGDFVNARLWSIPVASVAQGITLPSSQFTDRTAAFVPAQGTIGSISSFGQDDFGNVYVVDYDGEIFLVDEVAEAP
jgi:hypothetical protein